MNYINYVLIFGNFRVNVTHNVKHTFNVCSVIQRKSNKLPPPWTNPSNTILSENIRSDGTESPLLSLFKTKCRPIKK